MNENIRQLPKLVDELDSALQDPNVQIRSAALKFIARVDPRDPSIVSLVPLVVRMAGDRYYKITAEALRLCAAIYRGGSTASRSKGAGKPSTNELHMALKSSAADAHDAAKKRILALDQDAEVRVECSSPLPPPRVSFAPSFDLVPPSFAILAHEQGRNLYNCQCVYGDR